MTISQDPKATHTINVPLVLTNGFLWDIMTTAVETSYDWFRFRRVVRKSEDGEHNMCVMSCEAIEVDCDGDGSVLSRKDIHDTVVFGAIEKILAGGKVHHAHRETMARACANNDACDIDADLADCILQVACFDEIRYG